MKRYYESFHSYGDFHGLYMTKGKVTYFSKLMPLTPSLLFINLKRDEWTHRISEKVAKQKYPNAFTNVKRTNNNPHAK